ncbi:MAG: D-alanyl-D-alanine carboxypeptidase [uncultured Sphingomonadaceae bacterium]|uniref:serine-type D-Ala-D-Ala carboxypeptidase n=1 Tax=uncultured Sphingomonadaceae bacterium TaxID=169976 RepID=A0A6J4T1H8_9SPHN|nr:MAG: D-alanyl-D-alanine carboxypeptidase [uncultured Sphingomonadaceae bacterium]
MKPAILAALTATLALPAQAAAPTFTTPAPVAFLKDTSSGAILFARDADRRIPPASMAKMMTTHVAFDLIDKGELKLGQMVTVNPETWRRWHGPAAGSTMFLSPNQQVSVENLLHGIVTLSGNDACVVLAEAISGTEEAFVNLMNKHARALGMRNSRFGNSNGWPDEGRTFTTARDLTTLAEATIGKHPRLYKQFYARPSFTWGQTMGGGQPIVQGNRNPILGKVAGADGLKTGHTEEAGYGFTGSAEQNGRRLIMVLAGLGSFNERINESTNFMNWGFRAWQARPLFAKGRRVAEAQVQLGGEDAVGLIAPRDLAVTIPAGLGSDMKVSVVYNGPLKAPIRAGQHVADLVVSTPDAPPQRMPLVAAEAVEEAGFFGRMWAGLTSLFGA